MSRFWEYLRVGLVSPEVLAVLLVAFASTKWPSQMKVFANPFLSLDFPEAGAIFVGAICLVVATYKHGYSILNPGKTREALLRWPDYWRLTVRVHIAVAFACVGAAAVFTAWILSRGQESTIAAIVGVSGTTVMLVSLATVMHARQQVRDILREIG